MASRYDLVRTSSFCCQLIAAQRSVWNLIQAFLRESLSKFSTEVETSNRLRLTMMIIAKLIGQLEEQLVQGLRQHT